jgi:hypothetical protein
MEGKAEQTVALARLAKVAGVDESLPIALHLQRQAADRRRWRWRRWVDRRGHHRVDGRRRVDGGRRLGDGVGIASDD